MIPFLKNCRLFDLYICLDWTVIEWNFQMIWYAKSLILLYKKQGVSVDSQRLKKNRGSILSFLPLNMKESQRRRTNKAGDDMNMMKWNPQPLLKL